MDLLKLTKLLRLSGRYGRSISTAPVRCTNHLGPYMSDNPLAMPKPEYVDGVGDAKAYGFPEKQFSGPKWYYTRFDDFNTYYRRPQPAWPYWPVSTAIYFYLLWSWYKHPEAVFGEPELVLPDERSFTDEELGIPSDEIEQVGLLKARVADDIGFPVPK